MSAILWVWYQPWGTGGVERYLVEQCRRFAARGWRVGVASLREPEGPLGTEYAGLDVERVDLSLLHGAFARAALPAPACAQVSQAISRFRPTVLAVNGCTDFALACVPLLKEVRRRSYVVDFVHIDPPGPAHFLLRRPYARLLDAIGTSSKTSVGRIRRALGTAAPDIAYVPYGVALPPLLAPRPTSERLRILYVGRIVQEQKRVLEIPGILARLHEMGRSFHLTIAGDGPDRPALECALTAQGVRQDVEFVGFAGRDEMARLYAEHDVLLNVSDYEGFSIAVLEAMSAGCVPVCTDLNGRDADVLRDRETCRLCSVERPADLGDILASLGAGELGRLSEAAEDAVKEFTLDRTFGDFLGVLEKARRARSVEPWVTGDVDLPVCWDMARYNPWLPRRPGLMSLLSSLRSRAAGWVTALAEGGRT